MGLLSDLFKGLRSEKELVELPEETEEKPKISIRIERLHDFVDVDRISQLLKEGNIVFLKTAELQKKDLGEFQNSVRKLKRECTRFGWDIVGLEEGYLILAPSFATIERKQ